MAYGLGALGLAPRDFWAMTPREFEAALIGAGLMTQGPAEMPSRADLAGLMACFPDR